MIRISKCKFTVTTRYKISNLDVTTYKAVVIIYKTKVHVYNESLMSPRKPHGPCWQPPASLITTIYINVKPHALVSFEAVSGG
jgi:hypothetical protein